MRIGIEGRIQTGTFTDKDGIKRKSFDIIVSKHHFCDSKDVSGAGEAPAAQNTGMKENTDGFYEIDEDMEDDDLLISLPELEDSGEEWSLQGTSASASVNLTSLPWQAIPRCTV